MNFDAFLYLLILSDSLPSDLDQFDLRQNGIVEAALLQKRLENAVRMCIACNTLAVVVVEGEQTLFKRAKLGVIMPVSCSTIYRNEKIIIADNMWTCRIVIETRISGCLISIVECSSMRDAWFILVLDM